MPRGDKSAYTEKQKRQAKHIEESEKERGHSEEEAKKSVVILRKKRNVLPGRRSINKTAAARKRKRPTKQNVC